MFADSVLLIRPAVVFEPTGRVLSVRVVVGPVDLTAFFVPQVLTVEAHAIAWLQRLDPGCDVYVMDNQHRLT